MLKTVKTTTIVTLAALTLGLGFSTQASAETIVPSINTVVQTQTLVTPLSATLSDTGAINDTVQVANFRRGGFRSRGFNRGFRNRGFNRGFRNRGFNRGFKSRGFGSKGFKKFKYYY